MGAWGGTGAENSFTEPTWSLAAYAEGGQGHEWIVRSRTGEGTFWRRLVTLEADFDMAYPLWQTKGPVVELEVKIDLAVDRLFGSESINAAESLQLDVPGVRRRGSTRRCPLR